VASVTETFDADRAAVARAMDVLIARYLGDDQGPVADAIRYSLAGEGKRIRAILVLEAYRAAGGVQDATELAAAIEIVHAYSLVHDDLPCMDNDDMRRGRLTVHRVFGVGVAAAAGLAMVPLAVRASLEGALRLGVDTERRAEIVRVLMRASGAGGMIGGQVLDLEGEGLSLDLEQLERIHRLKTGALIEAAMVIGGLAAAAPPALLEGFRHYGAAIGLAFQIADDILDVTGTSLQLGKTAGKDVQLMKSTHPSILGLGGATARAASLVADARAALQTQGALTPAFESLARFVIARTS
jgi:geranylgeranyl pyrophosphate synthase